MNSTNNSVDMAIKELRDGWDDPGKGRTARGLEPKDIDVDVTDNVLTPRGEKKMEEKKVGAAAVHRGFAVIGKYGIGPILMRRLVSVYRNEFIKEGG